MASGELSKGDPEVLTEIPDELKKLAKYVMRGFYPIEHVLIVDLLVRNVIMKDEDLADLLKFDKKQLRIMLNKLKNDKLLRSTLRVETDQEGKPHRHNYYFINYKVFVNVVKYKLDKMRQKIESRERESTSKALYKCANCDRQYNEYDANDLMDFMTGEMKCTLCGSEVQEDETEAPEKDSYMQIALFNEQMRPLYDLLKEVEHVKLSPDILEPTPKVAADAARARQPNGQYRGSQGGWSESSRPSYDLYNQEVTIDMGSESNKSKEKEEVKERPSWMTQSTVDGAIIEMDSTITASNAKKATVSKTKSQDQEEIMKALLVHERKSAAPVHVPSAGQSDNESDESASEDEFPESSMGIRDPGLFGKRKFTERKVPAERMEVEQTVMAEEEEEDEEEEEEEEVMVSVKGQMVALSEVTEHHVAEMTTQEKQEYIKLAQEAYAAMHD